MNKKRTNYFVAILNLLVVITIYIVYFSTDFLKWGIISSTSGGQTIYDSVIVNILVQNAQPILVSVCMMIGILNIVCAIQNKQNKKICFWQFIFGIEEIVWIVLNVLNLTNTDLQLAIDISVYAAFPIILAIKNLICIKKNQPKAIQIVSYILTIIVSALIIFDIINPYWNIICIIMQFIYIHFQDKYIQESKTRRIVNVILYYIIQAIISIGIFVMVIGAIIINQVNTNKMSGQVEEILNNVANLSGITNEEPYSVVEKDSKYGFMNEQGEETILCDYDRVSYFYSTDIHNQKCYFALAAKENEYYIISKNNQKVNISDNVYFRNIVDYVENQMIKYIEDEMTNTTNHDIDYFSINAYSFALQALIMSKTSIDIQRFPEDTFYNEINLQTNYTESYEDLKLYYENENFTMTIEPMETDYSEYNMDTKCEVTIKKNNGEENSNIEYLPGLNQYTHTLEVLNDESIVYKTLDEQYGWYNLNGDKVSLASGYEINNIINDIIIVEKYDEEKNQTEYYFLDESGNILLKSYDVLSILENTFVVRNEENKMFICDQNLNNISDEYDLIMLP